MTDLMTDRELAGCPLLPCPFCGGEAKRDDRTEYQSYSASESQSMGMGVSAGGFSRTTYAIQCGCGIRVQGNNDAFLIERWNRRTPSSEGDRRDGERWRYVRAHMDCLHLPGLDISGPSEERIDAAIDAAMKKERGT